MNAMGSIFGFFLSPWGVLLLATLDSSLVFFLPLALDMTVVLLAAEHGGLFWVFPLLATAGSLIGATGTYMVGDRLGEPALERFVSRRRLDRIEDRIGERGAMAIGVHALIPPPFPFTVYILGSGALGVPLRRFLTTLAGARLLRFGVEAGLATVYGSRITRWMETTTFQIAVGVVIGLSLVGTGWGLWRVYRGRL